VESTILQTLVTDYFSMHDHFSQGFFSFFCFTCSKFKIAIIYNWCSKAYWLSRSRNTCHACHIGMVYAMCVCEPCFFFWESSHLLWKQLVPVSLHGATILVDWLHQDASLYSVRLGDRPAADICEEGDSSHHATLPSAKPLERYSLTILHINMTS
jgi:hypothetical protein